MFQYAGPFSIHHFFIRDVYNHINMCHDGRKKTAGRIGECVDYTWMGNKSPHIFISHTEVNSCLCLKFF